MAKTKGEKNFEEQLEKEVEEKVEERVNKFFGGKDVGKKVGGSKQMKIFGELVGYGIFLIFLFVVFPKLSFITDDYDRWKLIGFWATTISTYFKIMKHALSMNFFKRVFEIASIMANFYSTYMILVIFPVDFSLAGHNQFNTYFRYMLYLVMFAMSISVLVNFIRIFIPERKKKKK